MKKFILVLGVLSCLQSFAGDDAESICIVKNGKTGRSSDRVPMIDVNTYKDALMNTQEVSFEDLHVVFSNGSRQLSLYRNGNFLGETQATPMTRALLKLSIQDEQTDQLSAE